MVVQMRRKCSPNARSVAAALVRSASTTSLNSVSSIARHTIGPTDTPDSAIAPRTTFAPIESCAFPHSRGHGSRAPAYQGCESALREVLTPSMTCIPTLAKNPRSPSSNHELPDVPSTDSGGSSQHRNVSTPRSRCTSGSCVTVEFESFSFLESLIANRANDPARPVALPFTFRSGFLETMDSNRDHRSGAGSPSIHESTRNVAMATQSGPSSGPYPASSIPT